MNTFSHYSIFSKNEIYYCIPIDNVKEVIKVNSLILTPLRIAGFLGYIDFRRSLCPVLDIAGIINSNVTQKSNESFQIMVIEYESTLFAVLIDRFIESYKFDEYDNISEDRNGKEREEILVNKVFRYKDIALYRLDLNYIKNLVLNNIKNNDLEPTELELTDKNQNEDIEEIEMICFTIESFLFGIPITDLIEVIEGYGMQPLFRVNKFLRGLINLRGQIIACVDISETIGLEPRKMEEKNQYIVIQNGDSDLALCIDMISKKQKFNRRDIQNVESIFSGELSDYLLGIIETNLERIFVISGPKIFESKYLLPNRE